MSTNALLRAAVLSAAALCLSLAAVAKVAAQDVGVDTGVGIFRAKNPETKKNAAKSGTGTKSGSRTTGPTKPRPSNVEERVEDLLDKGNDARDGKRFAEAEDAYKEVLKLKARDARAAYGLGAPRISIWAMRSTCRTNLYLFSCPSILGPAPRPSAWILATSIAGPSLAKKASISERSRDLSRSVRTLSKPEALAIPAMFVPVAV